MKKRSKRRQKPTGKVTIGRSAFAQISAVEGIQLTDEMWSDFHRFDQKRLSNTARRGEILRKYGNATR
jgi:hypothetical protein